MTVSDFARNRTSSGLGAYVLAPVGFLAAFLAVSPASGPFEDRPLPLPGAPAADVVGYFAANPAAVGVTAALQVVSVACAAVFVAALAPALGTVRATWLAWSGYLSVLAMVVSSALSVALAAVATSVDPSTAVLLRQASFSAGGVVTVVAIGVFVLGSALVLGRDRLFGGPVRWFGVVAGAIAVLSVLSLALYYASVALPVGRVLCMVWTIVAGVAVHRRVRAETR